LIYYPFADIDCSSGSSTQSSARTSISDVKVEPVIVKKEVKVCAIHTASPRPSVLYTYLLSLLMAIEGDCYSDSYFLPGKLLTELRARLLLRHPADQSAADHQEGSLRKSTSASLAPSSARRHFSVHVHDQSQEVSPRSPRSPRFEDMSLEELERELAALEAAEAALKRGK
jgi:hypothetical protein